MRYLSGLTDPLSGISTCCLTLFGECDPQTTADFLATASASRAIEGSTLGASYADSHPVRERSAWATLADSCKRHARHYSREMTEFPAHQVGYNFRYKL